jgi:hypothetical protein
MHLEFLNNVFQVSMRRPYAVAHNVGNCLVQMALYQSQIKIGRMKDSPSPALLMAWHPT